MKSLLWELLFCLSFLILLVIYIIYIVLKLILPRRVSRSILQGIAKFWAKIVILSTGSKVTVTGKENLPSSGNICFVSNHQGLFDIPLILGFSGIHTGFVAKRELFKIPVLSQWMKEIPCTFIDRRNPRKAIQTFQKSAELIKKGNPMVIFPEGTRSRSDKIGNFHLGSLKLPIMAEATIVPLAIKGSWRIYEIDKRIHSATVYLKILPPIKPTDDIYKDKQKLSTYLHSQISQALEE
jgi:1-acyl-sn-glycerol-3-phosphate acyltransferase